MSAAYLHIILSHVPVLGLLFASGLHLAGLLLSSRKVRRVSLLCFTLTGVLTAPLYFSGETSEEIAVKLLGASSELIQAHEDSAMVVFIGTTLLGVVSLVAFFVYRKSRSMPKGASIGLLVVAAVVLVLAFRAFDLGLQIRHPEVRKDAPRLPSSAPAPVLYEP